MKGNGSFDQLASGIARISVIRAIRKGLLYMMPLVLIGSVALMLLNLPIQALQDGMDRWLNGQFRNIFLAVYNGTFQVMALTALIAVSYAYAQEHTVVRGGEVGGVAVILTAFASYVAFTGAQEMGVDPEQSGSSGLFGAIVVALVSTRLFLFFYQYRQRLKIKWIRVLPNDADAVLLESFRMLLPALVTILAFAVARFLLEITGAKAAVISGYAQLTGTLIEGGRTFPVAVVFILLTHILWMFGLHGTNLLDGVSEDLFVSASDLNSALAQAGELPTEILTKEFFDNFVYLGGCGATLGLLVALFFAGRNGNGRQLAKVSFLPGLFNINEMMVYGLPVIFNPYYLVPFLATPVLLSGITYGAMRMGLVPLTVTRVIWTTPIFLSGYVSTGGSMAAVVLQGINLVLSVVIYLPFIRMYENYQSRNSLLVFQDLNQAVQRLHRQQQQRRLVGRADEVGFLARALALEIDHCIHGEKEALHLEYQPKVDGRGRVAGVEALLRWQHPVYGYIAPPVTLSVADEAGWTADLGAWVLQTATADLKRLHEMGYPLDMSVNISPEQLRRDDRLVERVTRCVEGMLPVASRHLELELTENAAIERGGSTRDRLEQIKALGVNISIDDFGMGHSSLLYLRDLYANAVKIDRSLVRHIHSDSKNQEIVRTVISLCSQLEVGVVAEGVETAEQVESLKELGCQYYQGFYFSRSLKLEALVEYIREHGFTGK